MANFQPQQIVEFVNKSGQVMSAIYKDIMADPEKKKFVLDTLKGVTTAYVAKHSLLTQTGNAPHGPVPVQVKKTEKEEVKIDNHTYSGSSVRRILSSLIMTILVAAGITGLYIRRDQLKTKVDSAVKSMNLDSVMKLLGAIIASAVSGLKKIHTSAANSFEKMLKKTKVPQ
jgi:hypothetical protein